MDGATKSLVNEFEREHSFGDEPLKGVIPAWPTVQQASFQDERVHENCKRRRPGGQSDPIDSIERVAIQRHQMLCLLTGILLLGGEPARERFAIVVKDHPGERNDFAHNCDPMAVALVLVARLILTI